jgi:hypothetical protein
MADFYPKNMSETIDISGGQNEMTLMLRATECTDSLRWISCGEGGAADGDIVVFLKSGTQITGG